MSETAPKAQIGKTEQAPLRLPEPSKALKRMPVVLCNRCDGSGWDPENPEALCRSCLGFRVHPNLPWAPVKPRAPRPGLRPDQVTMLRHLDTPLPEYPAEGTPEWDRFVADTKARTASMVKALKERLAARPPNVGRYYRKATSSRHGPAPSSGAGGASPTPGPSPSEGGKE